MQAATAWLVHQVLGQAQTWNLRLANDSLASAPGTRPGTDHARSLPSLSLRLAKPEPAHEASPRRMRPAAHATVHRVHRCAPHAPLRLRQTGAPFSGAVVLHMP